MPDDIVILTGAGISAESGIATFRDKGGIWENVRIEDVATPEAFARDPQRVQQFYNARRAQLLNDAIQPNKAHYALAQLQKNYNKGKVHLVTQNIDDLHERAGSTPVVHMHGELLKARCTHCNNTHVCKHDLDESSQCTTCGKQGTLRPHVVWFGEMPLEMDAIYASLEKTSTFISIGTSGNVYPAAGFVEIAKRTANARTIEINLEPTNYSGLFDEMIPGPATQTVPKFVEQLI